MRFVYVGLIAFLLNITFIQDVATTNAAIFELVKGVSFDTVYYVDDEDVRHPFPNLATYRSWYGDDFSDVRVISDELLSSYPIGSNIVMRSGNLLKVPSAKEVYVTELGGVLLRIEHEDLAVNFFGAEWNKRVTDLPEVFFSNYTISDPILTKSDVPDGVVYQIVGESTYYWKNQDVLTRFDHFDTIVKNKFDTSTIIRDTQSFFTRNHIISELEESLFNPVVKANMSTADCSAEKLKAGILYLHEGGVDDVIVENLNLIKNELPKYWHEMSRTFSSVEFPFPIQLVEVDENNRIPNEFGRYEVTHEVGFDYYRQLPDSVDFIIVFTDFPVGEKLEAFFSPITQSIEGIGKHRLDRSSLFGSQGKLKGMVVMGDLDTYSFFEPRRVDGVFNNISHELLHNWSGTLKFRDGNRSIRTDLLSEDGKHWSPWVTFSSPLGGKGWHSVGEGRVAIDPSLSESLATPFSDLDLYAMGLLPSQVKSSVGYVDEVTGDPQILTHDGSISFITMDDIISAHGRIKCVLPSS